MDFRPDRRPRKEWSKTGGPRCAARRQAGRGVSRSCMARSAIQLRSADSLPYARCRLPSALVRASQRPTRSGTLPERAFSAPAMARTSSKYCANVTWGRGSLGRRSRRSAGAGSRSAGVPVGFRPASSVSASLGRSGAGPSTSPSGWCPDAVFLRDGRLHRRDDGRSGHRDAPRRRVGFRRSAVEAGQDGHQVAGSLVLGSPVHPAVGEMPLRRLYDQSDGLRLGYVVKCVLFFMSSSMTRFECDQCMMTRAHPSPSIHQRTRRLFG